MINVIKKRKKESSKQNKKEAGRERLKGKWQFSKVSQGCIH